MGSRSQRLLAFLMSISIDLFLHFRGDVWPICGEKSPSSHSLAYLLYVRSTDCNIVFSLWVNLNMLLLINSIAPFDLRSLSIQSGVVGFKLAQWQRGSMSPSNRVMSIDWTRWRDCDHGPSVLMPCSSTANMSTAPVQQAAADQRPRGSESESFHQ